MIDYIDIATYDNILLINSSKNSFIDFVKCLVSRGADINDRDSIPSIALIRTAERGYLQIVNYLQKIISRE